MKDLITKETKEIFEVICSSCGKKIQGSTKNEVVFNLAIHKKGKACFEQRVQNELPERTPGYNSPRATEEGESVAQSSHVTSSGVTQLSQKDESLQEGAKK